MKKILITGGAGFVGRRFTKYFLEKRNTVLVVDNISKYTGGIHPKNGQCSNRSTIKILDL